MTRKNYTHLDEQTSDFIIRKCIGTWRKNGHDCYQVCICQKFNSSQEMVSSCGNKYVVNKKWWVVEPVMLFFSRCGMMMGNLLCWSRQGDLTIFNIYMICALAVWMCPCLPHSRDVFYIVSQSKVNYVYVYKTDAKYITR